MKAVYPGPSAGPWAGPSLERSAEPVAEPQPREAAGIQVAREEPGVPAGQPSRRWPAEESAAEYSKEPRAPMAR